MGEIEEIKKNMEEMLYLLRKHPCKKYKAKIKLKYLKKIEELKKVDKKQ